LLLKPGSQHWGLYTPCELENRVNVSHVSILDVKEPLRMASTLAVTTLSASIKSRFGDNVLKKISNLIRLRYATNQVY